MYADDRAIDVLLCQGEVEPDLVPLTKWFYFTYNLSFCHTSQWLNICLPIKPRVLFRRFSLKFTFSFTPWNYTCEIRTVWNIPHRWVLNYIDDMFGYVEISVGFEFFLMLPTNNTWTTSKKYMKKKSRNESNTCLFYSPT